MTEPLKQTESPLSEDSTGEMRPAEVVRVLGGEAFVKPDGYSYHALGSHTRAALRAAADALDAARSPSEPSVTTDAETVAKAETMLRWLRETGDVEVEGESVADLLDGLLRPASAPLTSGKYVEGTWPEHCEQRAFVAGAKWWEFTSTGGTMWPSDRDKAEAEAVRRYGIPTPAPESSPAVDAGTTDAPLPKPMYFDGAWQCAGCDKRGATIEGIPHAADCRYVLPWTPRYAVKEYGNGREWRLIDHSIPQSPEAPIAVFLNPSEAKRFAAWLAQRSPAVGDETVSEDAKRLDWLEAQMKRSGVYVECELDADGDVSVTATDYTGEGDHKVGVAKTCRAAIDAARSARRSPESAATNRCECGGERWEEPTITGARALVCSSCPRIEPVAPSRSSSATSPEPETDNG